MELKKAKISRGKFIEVTISKPGVTQPREAGEIIHDIPHDDLVAAWDALQVHLGVMTGYISHKLVGDIENPNHPMIKDFIVSAFSIGGGDDKSDGVVLSGHYKMPTGKAVILNTPFYRFEEKEESRYPFMEHLVKKLDTLKAELMQLFKGTKVGKDPQGDLFEAHPQEKKVTKIQIAPEETLLNGGNGKFIPGGGKKGPKEKGMPAADPEAMARVAEMDQDEQQPAESKKSTKRRGRQTPANKAGEPLPEAE